MIELDSLTKGFNGKTILDRFSLRIKSGKTIVLIGASGCGKSTILRLILGLLRPDSGDIIIAGNRLKADDFQNLRRRTGYVIQDGGLFPHLTAGGNISLMAVLSGWRLARISDRLAELADLAQFPTDGLERYPVELSGGQRQRVALMRALMLDPELLLMDEPLGALDPLVRYDLQVDLRRIFRRLGKTVLLVTHDLAEAGYFGDEIVLIRDGRVAQQGTLMEMFDDPADDFVRRFVNAQRGLTLAEAENDK